MADFAVDRQGKVLKVSGAVSLATVPALLVTCLPAASADGMVLDLAAANPVDSSALALLIALRRATEAKSGVFEVRSAPAALHTLAGLYGVDFLIDNKAPAA